MLAEPAYLAARECFQERQVVAEAESFQVLAVAEGAQVWAAVVETINGQLFFMVSRWETVHHIVRQVTALGGTIL